MPNPYEDFFDFDDDKKSQQPDQQPKAKPGFKPTVDLNDPQFFHSGPDALDTILADIDAFNEKAVDFSKLLSQLRVADHQVSNRVARMFFVVDDAQDRGTLHGERQYHELQEKKFRLIIAPMRELAELHLQTVKHFNRDIDKNYYSLEKTEREVQSDITKAIDGINLQRRVLADANDNLETLTIGLKDTERRIKTYVNQGGKNNISVSEFELITRNRTQLTGGHEHKFDYSIFDVNLLDKTAFSLGIYLKETSNQYLGKLQKALG